MKMTHKFDSLNISTFEDSSACSVVAKLRRLKIQESLCVSNINKIAKGIEDDDKVDLPLFYSLETKQFTTKVKNGFSEINNMFEDIKAQTEEKLSNLDIENMKRDVFELDDKIRSFKTFIQSELASTTSKEEELIRLVNDDEYRHTSVFKSKTRIKPFNYIVPSPVKVLIKSPFKCKEVQELQEFIMNSPNRYGGWNEYNHNIFVQVWQKYFNVTNNKSKRNAQDTKVGNTDNFEAFQREILQKIAGSTTDEVVSHQQWYSKYLCLKEQQQNALNKWRKSKQMLMNTQNKHQGHQKKNSDEFKPFNSNKIKCSKNEVNMEGLLSSTLETNNAEEIGRTLYDISFKDEDLVFRTELDTSSHTSKETNEQKKRTFSDIGKPTLQWANRCNNSQDSVKEYNNLDNIKKLRVPDWRQTLKD